MRTVFRESGAALAGEVRKRFYFEREEGGEGGETYCLDYERHVSLVTPRPGLSLDGSMGCLPPREQELVVLYVASGGEISAMYIARDAHGHGADAAADQALIEATDHFRAFRRKVDELSGGEPLAVHFNSY